MFTIDELLTAARGTRVGLPVALKEPRRVHGISIDSRTISAQDAFVAIKGNNFDGHDFASAAVKNGARVIIIDRRRTREILLRIPAGPVVIAVEDTLQALGCIARFHRGRFDIPVIAVTGSNGKTTTKEMIAHVLSKRFNLLKNEGTRNNAIGVPMTLLNLTAAHTCAVLEFGTNHPGEIARLGRIAAPSVGVITNIGPAHLEFFKNLPGVMEEKWSLARYLQGARIMLLNADDPFLRRRLSGGTSACVTIGFGIKKKSDFSAAAVGNRGGRFSFRVNNAEGFLLRTWGEHNIYNALAAAAAGRVMGLGYRDIISRLSAFSFPQSRLDLVEVNRARIINDTYNSNPGSLKPALAALSAFRAAGRRIFVMGDMMELGEAKDFFHRQAGKEIARSCDCLIAVGELSKLAAEAAQLCGLDSKSIFTCGCAPQAKKILFKELHAGRGDIVLVKGSRSMRMEQVFERDKIKE